MSWSQIRWESVAFGNGGALHTYSIAASPYPESSSPDSLACHFCFWFPENIPNPQNIMYFVLSTFQVHISSLNWREINHYFHELPKRREYWRADPSTLSLPSEKSELWIFSPSSLRRKWGEMVYPISSFLGSDMLTSCQSLYPDKTYAS